MLTLFLNPLSSDGVKESALPMTGITLTRGESRRMSSMSISRSLFGTVLELPIFPTERPKHVRMSRVGDEIQEGMDTVVPEAWVTLDPGLLRENVVVLTLEVAHNLLEAKVT
jgi:hypothetical protein